MELVSPCYQNVGSAESNRTMTVKDNLFRHRMLILVGSVMAISLATAGMAEAQEPGFTADVPGLDTLRHLVNWTGVVTSLVIVFISLLTLRFVSNIVDNLGEVFAERRLRFQKINAFFSFFVYIFVAVIVVLLSFRISEQTLALMGGAVAFAFGFAAKDLVASLVAGFMIMADRPFQVGDRVSFGSVYGDVTAIGLRSVRVRTLDDSVVTIPNNMFLTDVTICGNYGVLHMQIDVDLHIGIDQDIKLACDLAEQATATSRFVFLQNPIEVRVKQVMINDVIAIRLRIKAYVLDTKYEKAFESDVTMRSLEAFAEHGIQPPALLRRRVD